MQPCLAELDHEPGEAAGAEDVTTCYAMCAALLEGTGSDCSACLGSTVIGPEAWDEGDVVLCELERSARMPVSDDAEAVFSMACGCC